MTFANTMANIETHKRMKSSELLRHCVDTYLSPTLLTREDQRATNTTHLLCYAMMYYQDDLDHAGISREDYEELDVQVARLMLRISDNLVQGTTVHGTIAGWLQNSYPEQHSEEDIQNIALELEDEGD